MRPSLGASARTLADASRQAATLEQPDAGLTEQTLAETDVLTWWGACRHEAVDDKVVDRVDDTYSEAWGSWCCTREPLLEDLLQG